MVANLSLFALLTLGAFLGAFLLRDANARALSEWRESALS
jgi:hypothetical protein